MIIIVPLIIIINEDSPSSPSVPFCYLYAVQGPQATMIPLFLAHFTNYKEVTDDDDDDHDESDDDNNQYYDH